MTGSPFVSQTAIVRRSRRGLSKLFARVMLGLVVGPVAITLLAALLEKAGVPISPDFGGHTGAFWVPVWLVGVPVAALAAAVAGMRYPKGVMTVDADRSGLRLAGKAGSLVVARDAIRSALVVDGAEPEVEIALAGDDVLHVGLRGLAQAKEMVAALGFGASDRWIAVPLGTAREPLIAGCAGAVLAGFATALATCVVAVTEPGSGYVVGTLLAVLFMATTLALARLFTPGRLVLGTDGILVEKAFRRRLLPRASIVDVVSIGDGLAVVHESGGRVRTTLVAPDQGARRAALATRIRAMIAAPGPPAGAATRGLLARGERSFAGWREGLRKLAGARAYRDEVVSADVLLQTAEAPDAPAEQRLGAAMVIGFGDDMAAKQRLRVAAEGIADAGLRAAMERAAEGEAEAEAIEEAIEAARRTEAR